MCGSRPSLSLGEGDGAILGKQWAGGGGLRPLRGNAALVDAILAAQRRSGVNRTEATKAQMTTTINVLPRPTTCSGVVSVEGTRMPLFYLLIPHRGGKKLSRCYIQSESQI